jgi:dihydrolipoamide dehydrogenase
MIPILMPQVGHDIPAGVVTEWMKAENDPVKAGEIIVYVESEKAVFSVEAEASGVLLKIVHQAGDEVPILTPIGYIGEPGESVEL